MGIKISNNKSQILNKSQLPKFEISNVLVIEYWNLRFVCNLLFEIWDLPVLLLLLTANNLPTHRLFEKKKNNETGRRD